MLALQRPLSYSNDSNSNRGVPFLETPLCLLQKCGCGTFTLEATRKSSPSFWDERRCMGGRDEYGVPSEDRGWRGAWWKRVIVPGNDVGSRTRVEDFFHVVVVLLRRLISCARAVGCACWLTISNLSHGVRGASFSKRDLSGSCFSMSRVHRRLPDGQRHGSGAEPGTHVSMHLVLLDNRRLWHF